MCLSDRSGLGGREQKAKEKEAKAAADKERIAAAAAAAKRELQAKLGHGKGLGVQQQQQQREREREQASAREQRTLEEFEQARAGRDATKVRANTAVSPQHDLAESLHSCWLVMHFGQSVTPASRLHQL